MRMKRKIKTILAALLFTPMTLFGQTYQSLWKQVEAAQNKDLPQTAMQFLSEIQEKSRTEQAYGQLLKSTLYYSKLQAEVAPDSLRPAVSRLEQQEQKTTDVVLKAVYDVVLSAVYADNSYQLEDEKGEKSKEYHLRAMENPEALAQVRADIYNPFVVNGKDSEAFFGDDLLSVVGSELGEWQWLHDYYVKTDNRRAACLTGARATETLSGLDSLIAIYGDLPEACEIAIKRYQLMNNATSAEKTHYVRQSLAKWGGWKRANVLRNAERELTRPTFNAVLPQSVAMSNESQTIKLNQLRNIETLTMRVYQTKLEGNTDLSPNIEKDYKKIKAQQKELPELARTLTFSGHLDYEVFEDSIVLAGLPVGVYLMEFTAPQMETSRALYFVSDLRVMMLPMPNEQMRYVTVNARTGQPVSNATLRLTYRANWKQSKKTEEVVSNQQGEVIVDQAGQSPSEVFAYTKTDKYCPSLNGYGRYSYYERQYHSERTNLFTDRSIYRPGQTVYVSAIVWKEQSALDNVAVADRRVKMELRDANYKLVAEQWVTTDRFGKCSTEFMLPTGLLNGRFTVRANGSSTSISVEEYKRPTFQVEYADYQQSYQAGDTVRVQGKAVSYAGVPVQDAKVKYTVKRRVAYWWMSYSWYWQGGYFGRGLDEEVLYEGEAVTAEDGTFESLMPLLLPEDIGHCSMFYNFVVDADVTDVAGETHSGTMSLPLGTKPTALTCDLPQKVRSDQLPAVSFSRRNAAGKQIEGTVKYRIDGGKWQECAANTAFSLPAMKSGEHKLFATCEADSVDITFIVFGLDDKKPAAETHDWFYVSHSQFPKDGTPVTVQVGSSDPALHIVYGIFAGDKVIESGTVKRHAELLNRKFTYKEEYGNGLLLTFAWVKDGQCYRHSQTITRPMPDKRLKLTWETFRDRLTPGQQEEWRLKIQNPDGTPADASLMAVLYDMSLDQIKHHSWSFYPTNYLPQPSTSWQWRSWGELNFSGAKYLDVLRSTSLLFSHFDSSVYPSYTPYRMMVRGAMHKAMGAAVMSVERDAVLYDVAESAPNSAAMEEAEAVADEAPQATEQEQEQEQESVQMRENLNETAFCYPLLETDKDGGVTLKFTLPECLTTWRFMGVANTADMLYGSIGAEAVAKKDVMVQPNIPRFIRMGDEAQISARIFNTGENTVSGMAKMQLTDPETGKAVYEQQKPVTIEAGKTGAVTFNVQRSTFNSSLLVCKVMVSGEGFSDGEQHYLPILPDREYVTKTVPYTQHEPGVKTIDLTQLFPTGTTQQKLTIEYTNNPAWLMVQSLPLLGQPWEHSAIDQAASYYSNLLAKTLLAQSPQVKTMFELWKRETGSETSLMSNLQKDQELKDLILAETPWVGAADRESEQKQRLADFFDENGINNRISTAIEKLKKLQNGDGSFSWYPDMPGSTSITVAVEEMLVRLNRMAGEQNDTKQIQAKAFDFIGKEMVELVAEMKKQEKKGYKPSFPSFTALRWLYLAAVDGRQLPAAVQSANDYLIALLKKDIKNQTIYEKALTAVVLSKHGETRKASEYVKSLKEYTVYTEEMGRYYDTRRASYSWYDYKIPTEVAAIEAIQTVTPQDQQTVDEMRRWLLQEKRTQAWSTPINSVNAIWAFLNGDSRQLSANRPLTVLAIDGSPVEAPAATAGIGYVKTAITEPQGKTFTATKTSEGTSWGAVYAQFFQKTSEVTASQSGITVKREVRMANDQQLTANSLSVGDRIKIRITIETTRDLDFVQVVDRRAACMEPVRQLSGYHHGAYVSPKDFATHYFYNGLAKGKHVIETEYYIDRAGTYETGTCTVGCAYAPEYRATAPSVTFHIR